MFLSNSTSKSGIYHLYFNDSITGKRRKVSTHTRIKSDAIKFLRSFQEGKLRKPLTSRVPAIQWKKYFWYDEKFSFIT